MKIILVCHMVEKKAKGVYRCVFLQLPHGKDFIEAEMDCPAVPGEFYNVLLKGIFPGCNVPCISECLSLTAREILTAVDLKTECQLLEEKDGTT